MQPPAPPTATIVALSVARPSVVNMNGREVTTSIVRSPSNLPLAVIEGGISENEPAVHTEHVLAFPSEHYDYWSDRLGTPRESWDWCWFGENLTVAGISEEDLHVGDVVDIGTARFRVTSPRIPCFKVAWRIGQPDSILPKLLETGRVGFHLEVLRPGTVRMTDVLTVSARETQAITVAELARLLLSQSPDALPRLKDVLALPALGYKARNAVRQRINLIEDKQRLGTGRWRGWRPFTVGAVRREAEGISSFDLRPEDGKPIAPPAPGQFLTVRLDLPGKGDVVRPWTISGFDLERNEYRITVRRMEGGHASQIMHERIVPKSRLFLRPPAGQFTLDRGGFRRIAMISGGIGVTPLLAMLKDYVALGEQAPPLLWLQVVRNSRLHPFALEVQALLSKAPLVQRVIWYTHPEADDVPGLDYDRAGRPTAAQIEEIVRPQYVVRPFGKDVPLPGTETEFYVCGPTGLEAMIRSALLGLAVRPGLVRSETFAAVGRAAPAAVDRARVHFTKSGVWMDWHADDGLTLLDLAEAGGLEPPYACRTGGCQSCAQRLVEGSVDYNPTPANPQEPGSVLLCCARPASTTLRIDL
ncbi:MOSC domain-containing protein [Aurantimonas aggregata]|uniref:MOSC domain-containing protein n=2 Tax=Aurantimonas aggregata TaxID=2047720 RepID=A0A6L9MIM2_9HYPH|nr:MOSC domain-containing protein [Aurantimonas aggregata]